MGKVIRSPIAAGDANVRMLLVVIADETGNPKQKDPDGWVELGMRTVAERIGCDLGTAHDVIKRAEKLGLEVERPGEKRRMRYRLPEQLLAGGQQMEGVRSVGTTPTDEGGGEWRSVGTVRTDLLAPRQHDPSVTPTGDAATTVATGSPQSKPDGFAASSLATAPRATPDAGEDVAARWWERWDDGEQFDSAEDEEQQKRKRAALVLVDDARASPDPVDNGSRERTEVMVLNELVEREEAAVESPECGEPEPVTVVRHVGVDAVLYVDPDLVQDEEGAAA